MFENIDLPIKFDDQPIKVGDKFKFKPNGIVHTVVWKESTLRFLLKFESKEGHPLHANIVHMVNKPNKWERV